MAETTSMETSSKKRLVALLLCVFFGWTGIHRFYVDKVGTGIALLLTFGGFGMWIPVDIGLILFGLFKDKDGKVLKDWM
ncbi:MAG TPA: TM2 domain-containing protein [Thermodesulfovibrionia bacterium]|nr:TM2 domain-containing protein [Thermodesulfovibrionia bacterium]